MKDKIVSPAKKVIRDKNFEIKVSDLLKNPWKTDQIVFEKKFSDDIQWLTDDGVRWVVNLWSLDKASLIVDINDISCQIDDTCDICSEWFRRDIDIETYEMKFIIPDKKIWNLDKDSQLEEGEVFHINAKNEIIDVEEMIVQAIKLEEPMSKKCNKCIENAAPIDYESEFEEEDPEYFQANNVRFL